MVHRITVQFDTVNILWPGHHRYSTLMASQADHSRFWEEEEYLSHNSIIGVPQGSVLGPLRFFIFTGLRGMIIKAHRNGFRVQQSAEVRKKCLLRLKYEYLSYKNAWIRYSRPLFTYLLLEAFIHVMLSFVAWSHRSHRSHPV